MKKIDDLISVSSLRSLLHRVADLRTEHAGANVAWRLFLGVYIVVLLLVAVAAWFVYGSVTVESSTLATLKAKDRQPVFSIEDLRSVITLYQKKEDDFTLLHSTVPTAPELHKGSGVSEQAIPSEQAAGTPPVL